MKIRPLLARILAGLALSASAIPAFADTVELVSVRSTKLKPYTATNASRGTTVSADGRFIAFASDAADLVANDTNHRTDVFVRVRSTGVIERISKGTGGQESNSDSASPVLSADGRYVAFVSDASNLVSLDKNSTSDVFVYDRQLKSMSRVSLSSTGAESRGDSAHLIHSAPSISGDGRFIAFTSTATNLVSGANTTMKRVYLRDRTAGITTLQSVNSSGTRANADSYDGKISANGYYVVFESLASNLVPSDTNGRSDIFVRNQTSKAVNRVSVNTSGAQGNAGSFNPAISTDGKFVVFASNASNLIASDNTTDADIYLHDRGTGQTSRISSGQSPYFDSEAASPAISDNGRYVAYQASFPQQIYRRDRQTGALKQISSGYPVFFHPEGSLAPSISADGRFIAYSSDSPTLVPYDSNEWPDIFLYDNTYGVNSLVSEAKIPSSTPTNISVSGELALSEHGQQVAFQSLSGLLVDRDTNGQFDDFVRDRSLQTIRRVSVSNSGVQANLEQGETAMSANGRFAAFISGSTNLVPQDKNNCDDVFVYDLQASTVTRVSVNSNGSEATGFPDDCNSRQPAISADGRYVVFASAAGNLAPHEGSGSRVYLHDRQTRVTELISVPQILGEEFANSFNPSVTADGRFVVFESESSRLVSNDNNNFMDVFIRDRSLKRNLLVSRSPSGGPANSHSYAGMISNDGRRVSLTSDASNLVPSDSNGVSDVFVYEMQTSKLTRASVDSHGIQGNEASSAAVMSASGRFVAFASHADNLVASDRNNQPDIFLRDTKSGVTTLVSLTSAGLQTNDQSHDPSISADGLAIAFTSSATNLVAADLNEAADVFVRQRGN